MFYKGNMLKMKNKTNEMIKYVTDKLKFILSCTGIKNASNPKHLDEEAKRVYLSYFQLLEKINLIKDKIDGLESEFCLLYEEYKKVVKSDKLFMKYGEALPIDLKQDLKFSL